MSTKPSADLGDMLGDWLRRPENLVAEPAALSAVKHREKVFAETVELRITGMVELAYAGYPKAEVDAEIRKVLAAYRKSGPLARLLQRFIAGEPIKRPRGAAEHGAIEQATRQRRFELCVRVHRLPPEELAKAWLQVGDRRPKGKRGVPTADRFILAACLDDKTLAGEKAAIAGKSFRRTFDRCVKSGEYSPDDVSADGISPSPPRPRRTE